MGGALPVRMGRGIGFHAADVVPQLQCLPRRAVPPRVVLAATIFCREEVQGQTHEAEARAAAAEAAAEAAQQQLSEAQAALAAQAAALSSKYEPQLAEARVAADQSAQGAEAAKRWVVMRLSCSMFRCSMLSYASASPLLTWPNLSLPCC